MGEKITVPVTFTFTVDVDAWGREYGLMNPDSEHADVTAVRMDVVSHLGQFQEPGDVCPAYDGIMDGLTVAFPESRDLPRPYHATVPQVMSLTALRAMADRLEVRPDWHEPDEQAVTAEVHGTNFDNAGHFADNWSTGKVYEEMHVILFKDGEPVCAVNLAILFAWACGFQG